MNSLKWHLRFLFCCLFGHSKKPFCKEPAHINGKPVFFCADCGSMGWPNTGITHNGFKGMIW